jgi:myo-inositol 2-dehydrogenase / D-chiro-inositol 1-dehydrogenase
MNRSSVSRRRFLQAASAAAAGGMTPYVFTAEPERANRPRSQNDRFRIGAIGMRYQGTVITKKAVEYGDVVAIADVDREIGEKAVAEFGGKAQLYEDYRQLLDRKDIDVVMIGTPDHWHTKIVVDACRAGKDIYCEKPLTLTVDEGKTLCRVVRETGRVVQVGTWQRSDWRFRLACEMVRAGRVGKLQTVTMTSGQNPTGGPFKSETPPANLNWDLWQGQTPNVPYIKERCHYTFRWWYEYSGGQMTDWGAHIVDIAQWGMGLQHSGPIEIDGQADKVSKTSDCYNVPPKFSATMRYANGVETRFYCEGRQGVMFEGDQGRIFVNRGTLSGKPVEDLKDNPLPPDKFQLYAHDNPTRPARAGKLDAIINHMGNFFDCVQSRRTPISDVVSQHRTVSACHLGNISIRLGRKLRWNPEQEIFVGDDEANTWLRREQRKPYQVA